MELTYEQIPQHQYLIEGQPARTFGEWPGVKSNHWRGSIRVIRPNQTQRIFDGDAHIPLLGRRHFSQTHSKEWKFVPGTRQFQGRKALTNVEERPQGLKKVDIKYTINKYQYDKKHFPPRFGINNDPEILHIRCYNPDGNTCTTNEIPIEKEFGIKKKLYTLSERRNGIEVVSQGDKHYKASENFSNFYRDGGLIVGSTNRINYNKTMSKKANNFYETLDLTVKTLDKKKLWNNKVKKENLDFDTNYVKTLTEWEKNTLGELPKVQEKEKNPPKDAKKPAGKGAKKKK